MKNHQLNKYQLKKLIKEVIREAEEMSTGSDEKDEKEPTTKPGEPLKHSTEFEKHQEDNVIKLTLRGVKPGRAYKDMMAAMAWEAKKQDLEVIHAEIDKAGKPVVSMDSGELKSMGAHHAPEEEHGAEEDVPAYRKKAEYSAQRMAKMQQGEREPEWKAATERDLADARAKEKLKAAKIAAGTYDPNDTSLWTDREWDAWNRENPEVTSTSGKDYKPSFKKSDIAGRKLPKVNVGTLRHQ